jgi:iron uptake system EfeUOB component EfeO/EfeM
VPVGVRPVLPQPLVPRMPLRWLRRARSGGARRRAAGPGLAAAALAVVLAGCAAGGPAPNVIAVSAGQCGTGWRQVAAGLQTFQLRNAGTGAAAVDLVDPATGAVYAEVAVIAPGTTRPMQADLGAGRYAFRCLLQPGGSRTGPAVRIGGHRRGATAVLPVTTADLAGPARVYRSYVTAGLSTLARQVGVLAADIRAGRLATARSDWLAAHLSYARLAGAYAAFGNYDAQIDGLPDGLPGGVTDSAFTGFYRLEYGLWHGQRASQLAGPATALDSAVRALDTFWPSMQLPLTGFTQAAQRTLEDTAQFQLTGQDDFGSETTLATAAASIGAVQELLAVLHPVLVPRDPALSSASAALGHLETLVTAADHGGSWTAASKLGTAQRQQLDAAAGQALEDLAPVTAITGPRRM